MGQKVLAYRQTSVDEGVPISIGTPPSYLVVYLPPIIRFFGLIGDICPRYTLTLTDPDGFTRDCPLEVDIISLWDRLRIAWKGSFTFKFFVVPDPIRPGLRIRSVSYLV